MIHKQAVTEFLNRKVDNHNWLKKLSDAQLDEEIAALRPQPTFIAPLLTHQKVGFLLSLAYPTLFIQYEMGLGKTRLCLEIIKYLLLTKKNHLFLILAPTDEVVLGWQEETEKWTPNLPVQLLLGTREEKWANLANAKSGVLIGTYVGVATMVSELLSVSEKRRAWIPQPKFVNELTKRLTGVVYDESTRIKTKGTLSYAVANDISKAVSIRYALAGRPFGRDPLDLWAQFYLVDRGQTLSPTLGLYREAFFVKKASHWGGPYNFEYKFKKAMSDDLARITAHRSIRYSVDECDRLPDLIRIRKSVVFPKENEEYYQRVIKEIIAAHGNIREIKNGFLRLRQLSSGFLGLIDDKTEERVMIEFESNPKLALLEELIDSLPNERKAVVFHEFTFSGQKIVETLKRMKIKHGWLHGGTKDWTSMKQKFDNDPDYRVMVINSRKGAYGLNLQTSNYCFFYENTTSIIDREQCEKRIHRQGQQHKCFIYDLTVKDTVDDKILFYQQEGKDIYEMLTKDPKKFLGK